MSKLVDDSRPILEPLILHAPEKDLSAEEVTILAQLTFLKSVVSDHARRDHANRPPFFARADRFSFREARVLPPGFQVWLAFAAPGGAIFKGWYGKTAHAFEMNVFTHGMQCVLLQGVAVRHLDPIAGSILPPPNLTQHPAIGEACIEIWPLRGRSTFRTPRSILARQVIDDFAMRWGNLESGAPFPL